MVNTILLTSFDCWETHHRSNASDDLIAAMAQQNLFAAWQDHLSILRKLPVDFQLAPQYVIAELDALEPQLIVCCGMAEGRSRLTVESNGKRKVEVLSTEVLSTTVAINQLVEGLAFTAISHDAGDFVCNHLYYSVLKYIRDRGLPCQCLFVHVPVLNEVNLEPILRDFSAILHFCQQDSIRRSAVL